MATDSQERRRKVAEEHEVQNVSTPGTEMIADAAVGAVVGGIVAGPPGAAVGAATGAMVEKGPVRRKRRAKNSKDRTGNPRAAEEKTRPRKTQ